VTIRSAIAPAAWPTDAPVGVVLLHGFGSDERDLAGLSDHLPAGVPWVSLRGPLELPQGGAAWFPITTPGDPGAADVAAGTEPLWQWIDAHLPSGTLLLPIGFSQGGLMATQMLRTRPERLAAAAVLSGFVQSADQPADAALARSRPPAFWGRGDRDGVITAAAVARTNDWLPAHTTLVERVYPGLAHSIAPTELADLRSFLDDVLTGLN
jgi:phospholipase/carboxylesterase